MHLELIYRAVFSDVRISSKEFSSALGAELTIVVLKLPQTVLKERPVKRSDEATLNYMMVIVQYLCLAIIFPLL